MTQLLRRRGDEDGMSLVEMMVAILVLGIALAALAQALISSLRATREAQSTQVVTAAAMEMIEELHARDWNEATLYEADISTADTRWSHRVASDGTFEGLELVTREGPTTNADRNDEIPQPSWTETRDGITYTFDFYPVWVNRSADTGDGAVDTKRFVVITSWDDPIRGGQELRTAAERAPTQGEAASNSVGARFLLKYATPDPVDADPAVGTLERIDFKARTNVDLTGTVTATMEWDEPFEDAEGNVTYQPASESITLGTGQAGDDGGWITFAGTFNGRRGNLSENGKYRFPNGPVDVTYEGTTVEGEVVTTTLSFTVRNSPYEPSSGPVGGPTEGSTDAPVYSDEPGVGYVSVSDICSSSSDWKLTSGIEISFPVTNVAPPSGAVGTTSYDPDAAVTVSFPHWSKQYDAEGDELTNPDVVGSVSAEWQSGTQSSSTWKATVPVDPETLFRPGSSIDFTVDVTRSSDGANGSRTSNLRAINSSC